MFKTEYEAIVIVSEDQSFVQGVHCHLGLQNVNCLIERSFGYTDFKVLIEELIKEEFHQVEVITDSNVKEDELLLIKEIIETNKEKLAKFAMVDLHEDYPKIEAKK